MPLTAKPREATATRRLQCGHLRCTGALMQKIGASVEYKWKIEGWLQLYFQRLGETAWKHKLFLRVHWRLGPLWGVLWCVYDLFPCSFKCVFSDITLEPIGDHKRTLGSSRIKDVSASTAVMNVHVNLRAGERMFANYICRQHIWPTNMVLEGLLW